MTAATIDRLAPPRPHNNLLRALRDRDFALLQPHLEAVTAPAGEILYNPGDHVGSVYFPCGPSLASFLVSSDDGHDVETVLVGREGAVGGIVSLGHLPAYTRIVVKFGGAFLRLGTARLEAAKTNSPTLRHLFARYADCLLAQMFQSTACNAIHTVEQRAAKWLAAAMDRTGDHTVPLTQEELAAMLGVGRSYMSRVMQLFRTEGFLETRRGALVVRDLDALRRRSCRCDESVKAHFETVLRGVYPDEGDDALSPERAA